MTNADNSMLPEEQAKYIQQTIWTILTDPNPSILDVALLPILVTDPRNGFSEETRKELIDEFIKFTGTQNNQDLLSEQMKQINMSHVSMLSQINNSMQATTRQMDDNFRQCWIYNKNGFVNSCSQLSEELERKKGEWKKIGHLGRHYRCDQCGNTLDFDGVNAGRGDVNFCPNCGSEMTRGEYE